MHRPRLSITAQLQPKKRVNYNKSNTPRKGEGVMAKYIIHKKSGSKVYCKSKVIMLINVKLMGDENVEYVEKVK